MNVKKPLESQSLLLVAPRRMDWIVGQLLALGPHDLLLRTRAGAISIGAELPMYLGHARGSAAPAYPSMTGYESVAEVLACGAAVESVQIGERVVAFYGHRTAAVVPEAKVVPIPAVIPDNLALLLILACDTAKGISKLPLKPASPIAITGGGAIGLLTLFNLHATGMRHCLVIEPDAQRRALAVRLGAAATFAPDAPALGEYSCSAGFECSSRDGAFRLLQELLEPDGQICILADGNLEALTLTPAFHAKELTVVGSSDGLDYRTYATWFWETLQRDSYPLATLFEQTVDSLELPAVFEALATAKTRPIKVLVRYESG